MWEDVFTYPIKVTSGRPFYDHKIGLKINGKQKLADFFNKAFASPVQNTLVIDSENQDSSSNTLANAIRVRTGDKTDMLVSFVRTLRIPEDEREYNLPPGFDNFPLFPINRFSPNLPLEIIAQGGVFLPMYRK
jgi:hypothetical protein